MIVGYDPPNHALLLHFGRRQRALAPKLDAWEASYSPGRVTRVEMAFDAETHALVALHFCRRGLFLPSFDSREDLLSRWRFVHDGDEVRIDLRAIPKIHDPVWIWPGIQLFLSLPQRTGRPRPFLHGLRIHTAAQPIELDLEELDIHVEPNSLSEARVDMYCEVG